MSVALQLAHNHNKVLTLTAAACNHFVCFALWECDFAKAQFSLKIKFKSKRPLCFNKPLLDLLRLMTYVYEVSSHSVHVRTSNLKLVVGSSFLAIHFIFIDGCNSWKGRFSGASEVVCYKIHSMGIFFLSWILCSANLPVTF